MKLHWTDESTGRCGISISEIERLDAPPVVPDFWLDARPITLNNDRLAIASALIFGPSSLGHFQLPSPASAVTAECIVELAKPGFRSVEPIDWGPKPIPEGGSTLRISEPEPDNRTLKLVGSDSINVINFQLLRTSRFAGTLMGMGSAAVASNAWLFNRGSEQDPIAAESLLAAAVLFAEDLGCNTIELYGSFVPFRAPREVIERMLEATGLNLKVSSDLQEAVAR